MHVLVVGLGKSGIAAVRFFLGQGVKVSVTDAASRQNLDPDALKYLEDHYGIGEEDLIPEEEPEEETETVAVTEEEETAEAAEETGEEEEK